MSTHNQKHVVIVGRTNVGKSTLFNRLTEATAALVSDVAGTTRDYHHATVRWRGRSFKLVDTGGLDFTVTDPLPLQIRQRVEQAVKTADLLLFIVDGQSDTTVEDRAVGRWLKRQRQPVIVAVNKIDSERRQQNAPGEIYRLGFEPVIYVSAATGRGTGDLLDAIAERLPDTADADAIPPASDASVALLGKPNVGKSTLFNRLIGQDRMLVSPTPFTTREPVDEAVTIGSRTIVFIDTAGLRRSAKIRQGHKPANRLERQSEGRTRQALLRADIALLLLDITEPVSSQDRRLASSIIQAHKGCILVATKADQVPAEQRTAALITESVRTALPHLDWAPVVPLSAQTGWNVRKILPAIAAVQNARRLRVDPEQLTQLFRQWQRHTPVPLITAKKKRAARLTLTQDGITPPRFILTSNVPGRLPAFYATYIEHQLRRTFDFQGTPIVIHFTQYFGRT